MRGAQSLIVCLVVLVASIQAASIEDSLAQEEFEQYFGNFLNGDHFLIGKSMFVSFGLRILCQVITEIWKKSEYLLTYALIYIKTKILDIFLCQKGLVQGWLKYGLCCFYIYFLTSIRYIQICLSSSPFSKWTTADKKPERLAISCLDVLCKCIHHPPNVYTISQWIEIIYKAALLS